MTVVVLPGCNATMAGINLENRLASTMNGDKFFIISGYGQLGIASELSDKDRDAINTLKIRTEK